MSTNRVWAVRAGTDGIGIDLFHVYSPDMVTARGQAKQDLHEIGMRGTAAQDLFTVHGVRDLSEVPWNALLSRNPVVAEALDYQETDWSEFFPERPACTCPRKYATTQAPLGDDMHTAGCLAVAG